MTRWIHLVATVLVLGSGLALGPMVHADDDEGEPSIVAPQRVFTDNGITYVKLDHDTQIAIGLRTQILEATDYRARLQSYGRVMNLTPLLRDYQRLIGARAKATRSRAQLDTSQAEYRRLHGLYKHQHNVSTKELQAAHAVWLSDQAFVKAANVDLSTIAHQIEFQWGTSIAQWVREDKPSFQHLTQGKSRLVKLTLPLGRTPVDPPRSAQILLADGTTTTVSLISVAPQIEPDLQGQSYFFLAMSQLQQLNYGLRVTAIIPYGPAYRGVVVPDAAVVWSQGSAWTYIKADNGRFERKPVRTNAPVPGGWFQPQGLTPGNTVVTQGVGVLLSVQALATAPKSATGGDQDGGD